MRNFKTVILRTLFVVCLGLLIWQCKSNKADKPAATTSTVVETVVSTDASADIIADETSDVTAD